jgi:ABC-type transport system substrate-binding protein
LFRDLRFRQAVAHSLDKHATIENVYNGLLVPIWSAVSAGSPFCAGRSFYGGTASDDSVAILGEHGNRAHGSLMGNNSFGGYDPGRASGLLDEIDIVRPNHDGFREFANGRPGAFALITDAENARRVACVSHSKKIWRQSGSS